ncbi:CaiB/BaiF CoA transferase family protein [Chloroflexota bacterium]
MQMLDGYRALDLADGEAQLCGRILSDFGVDVIRVEKPGGDSSRNIGPFYQDSIHPEKSLWWYVLNANKRGITLDLETEDGCRLFKRLVKDADFVIESYPPGYMARLDLDYSALSEINPRVIVTSITPFGQTGPYKDFKASELEVMALSVFMFGTGDPDRPPVKPNYPLAGITSAITGASATMIAYYAATKSGKGQHVDVSAQAGPQWFTGNIRAYWQMEKREIHRMGQYNARRPDLNIRFVWPCKDGHVIFQLTTGVSGRRSNRAIAQWVAEEGIVDEYFNSVDWDSLDTLQESQEVIDRLERPIGAFLLSKTKQELAQEVTKRGILLGFIDNTRDLFQNPQLANGYWKEIQHPELNRSLTYPGHFIRSSFLECGIRHRAPLIGEHNEEIYSEIGVSKDQLLSLNQAGII